MSERILRFKTVSLGEILSSECALKKDPDNPFLGPGDRPEPYRTLSIAAAKMEPVFQNEQVQSPFIVNTPRGYGLLWRWWPDQIGVVLFKSAGTGNDVVLEDNVTFLEPHEQEHVTLDLTRIVLNPPNWS